MRRTIFLWTIITLVFQVSCTDQKENSWQGNLQKITELNCLATDYRKARFALADSMRFYQDSLSDLEEPNSEKAGIWKARLSAMEVRKKSLVADSRNLADSIRVELQRLTGHLTVDEKRIFNDSLQARSEECL